jgi:hypothetical protein
MDDMTREVLHLGISCSSEKLSRLEDFLQFLNENDGDLSRFLTNEIKSAFETDELLTFDDLVFIQGIAEAALKNTNDIAEGKI